MTKGRTALLVVAAMVFLTVGFVIGQMVQAAGTIPGSNGDPLVAQSYVEQVVGETVTGLQTKIDELQAKVEDLQQRVDGLSKETGSSAGTSAGSVSKEPSSSNSPKENNSSVTGKTVTVSGKAANIRTGPGTNYEIITTLSNGKKAAFIEQENGWVKLILSDGQEGWVADWLVKVE